MTMARIELNADTTGVVWKILKQAGDSVEADEPVMILESMKMEIPVAHESGGRVLEILVKEGDHVVEGQVVGSLES